MGTSESGNRLLVGTNIREPIRVFDVFGVGQSEGKTGVGVGSVQNIYLVRDLLLTIKTMNTQYASRSNVGRPTECNRPPRSLRSR